MIMADEPRPRPTLAELANQANGQPMQIAGKPADVCPYCGCALFVDGTRTGKTIIRRYVRCRNESCGKTFMSYQQPATLLREVDKDE